MDYDISERVKQSVERDSMAIPENLEREGVGIIMSGCRNNRHVRYTGHVDDAKTRAQIQNAGWNISDAASQQSVT
jgi:hypothetical protein